MREHSPQRQRRAHNSAREADQESVQSRMSFQRRVRSLAGVPSFALARVREANGNVNHAAWRKDRPVEVAA